MNCDLGLVAPSPDRNKDARGAVTGSRDIRVPLLTRQRPRAHHPDFVGQQHRSSGWRGPPLVGHEYDRSAWKVPVYDRDLARFSPDLADRQNHAMQILSRFNRFRRERRCRYRGVIGRFPHPIMADVCPSPLFSGPDFYGDEIWSCERTWKSQLEHAIRADLPEADHLFTNDRVEGRTLTGDPPILAWSAVISCGRACRLAGEDPSAWTAMAAHEHAQGDCEQRRRQA